MSLNIVHLDDDEKFLKMVSKLLEKKFPDLKVYATSDPVNALSLVESNSIECIVSDYEMPELNGLEFYGKVRNRDTEVPFILYTGREDEKLASRAISSGITSYLDKKEDAGVKKLAEKIREVA